MQWNAFVNRLDDREERPTLAEVGTVLRSFSFAVPFKRIALRIRQALESDTPLALRRPKRLSVLFQILRSELATMVDPRNDPFQIWQLTRGGCPSLLSFRFTHN